MVDIDPIAVGRIIGNGDIAVVTTQCDGCVARYLNAHIGKINVEVDLFTKINSVVIGIDSIAVMIHMIVQNDIWSRSGDNFNCLLVGDGVEIGKRYQHGSWVVDG